MPDHMDAVQQHAADLASDALSAHARRPRPAGLTHCEQLDCGAAIEPQRTAMGAQRCIDCQREHEASTAHLTAGRRR